MDKTVLLEVRDGVATVTLNRPEGANALNLAMGRDLLEAALRAEADPAIRAVVVTGAGKHFCFGGDLRGMADQGAAVGGYLNELTTNIHAAIGCFTRMKAPVIAAVNGTAAGGGVGLVCMTDLAIAGRAAGFPSRTPASVSHPTAARRFCCTHRRQAPRIRAVPHQSHAERRRGARVGPGQPGGGRCRGAAPGAGAGGEVRGRADGVVCRGEAAHGCGRSGPRVADGARRPHDRRAGAAPARTGGCGRVSRKRKPTYG